MVVSDKDVEKLIFLFGLQLARGFIDKGMDNAILRSSELRRGIAKFLNRIYFALAVRESNIHALRDAIMNELKLDLFPLPEDGYLCKKLAEAINTTGCVTAYCKKKGLVFKKYYLVINHGIKPCQNLPSVREINKEIIRYVTKGRIDLK